MQIIISYESGEPIYEQVKTQFRGQILSGEIKKGTMLPSIRALAKELQIGIITAKRAYDDLCAEGFLYSVQGKGIFVADFDSKTAEFYTAGVLKKMAEEMKKYAEINSISKEKFTEIIKQTLLDGEEHYD